MTSPFSRSRSTARIWLWTAVTVVLLSLFFAPVYALEGCARISEQAELSCTTTQLGLAGTPTNGWAWAAAVIGVLAVGVVFALRRSRASGSAD